MSRKATKNRGKQKYPIPEQLKKLRVTQNDFGKWLDKTANSIVRRDRKRIKGTIVKSIYRDAIYKAVCHDCDVDYYTGKKLNWKLTFSSAKLSYRSSKNDKYLPTIDHEKLSATLPVFRVCSMRTNKCKSNYSINELLEQYEWFIKKQKK